jgi:hypothetical protein
MIPEFQITSAMDFPDTSSSKVRGMLQQWAITIDWDYANNPDHVWLETKGVDGSGKGAPCELAQLGAVLKSLLI